MNYKLSNILPWLLVLPLFLLILFAITFYLDFPVYLGTEQSWLNTASIVNGFVTPMLTFATIILLWLTWNTSKKELKETREQLSFQSARDTLLIILDDLLVTLNNEITPSPSQINSCAEWKIHTGFSEYEKVHLKRLANIDFKECYVDEMAYIIKNSFEGKDKSELQSMIQDYIIHRKFEHLNQSSLDDGAYGYLIFSHYLISHGKNRAYFESAIEAIISIMGEISSKEKFQLLSQVIFCKLTHEVTTYLLMDLLDRYVNKSPSNPEKVILEGKVKVLNDIFRSTGKIDVVYEKYLFDYTEHKVI